MQLNELDPEERNELGLDQRHELDQIVAYELEGSLEWQQLQELKDEKSAPKIRELTSERD